MNIITIDCGASFVKGALFVDGVQKKNVKYASPAVNNEAELDECVQINALMAVVRKLLKELSSDITEAGLCVSNEMHGFLLADKAGMPITDYISWQKEWGSIEIDGKTSVEILSADEYKEDIRKSGMPLRSGLPSVNLLYLSRSHYLDKIDKEFYLFTLGDYIITCLSGSIPFSHPSNAAATGLYDVVTGDWNSRLCAAASENNRMINYPPVGTEGKSFELDGVSYHVLPALGDQQAALLGAGFSELGDISFNLGTGAQVSTLTDKPEFGDNYQIRPYFFGKYLKTVPHLPSGRAMNVYIRFIKDVLNVYGINKSDDEIWRGVLQAYGASEGSGIKCDLSFFENAITHHSKGNIEEIPEYGFTVGNLFEGVFSQMAENFKAASERVKSDISVKRIFFSGGIAQRFDMIRERIIEDYKLIDGIEVILSENDTLDGLYNYYKKEIPE